MKFIKTSWSLSVALLFGSMVLISCKYEPKETAKTETFQQTPEESKAITNVMTKTDQENLTPQMVLEDLKAGNNRFVNQETTSRNLNEQVKKTESGQYPKAFILSCVDSRVPVEDVFDQGIGDVFVGRVAGNFVDTEQLGSIEFATKVAGAKLVVIMGHKHCGAVKGAIDNAQLGNLTALLENIKPAVVATKEPEDALQRTSKNDAFVETVSAENVRLNIKKTLAQSPVLAEMQQKGEIKIIGAIYDLSNGKVTFLD